MRCESHSIPLQLPTSMIIYENKAIVRVMQESYKRPAGPLKISTAHLPDPTLSTKSFQWLRHLLPSLSSCPWPSWVWLVHPRLLSSLSFYACRLPFGLFQATNFLPVHRRHPPAPSPAPAASMLSWTRALNVGSPASAATTSLASESLPTPTSAAAPPASIAQPLHAPPPTLLHSLGPPVSSRYPFRGYTSSCTSASAISNDNFAMM
jgi:hypothetical protein